MRPWHRWVVFFVVAAIPLWSCFTGKTIGLWEHVGPMAGAAPAAPTIPWDVLQADACLQFFPWRDLVFTSWQGFDPPYYNPYQLAGVPLLANSQSAGFYPLHILVGLLHLPTSLGLTLLALFHLAWAGLGVDRLARRFGAHPMGALMGGLSFTLSPFMLGWTGLASVITTVAWIPWVLAAVHDLLAPPEEKPRLHPAVSLALCTGMMVLGGHLQFVAFGGLAAVVFAVCLAISRRPGFGRIALVLGGLVFGVLLAGPQLMPALEYSKHSHRRNVPTPEGFAAYQGGAIQTWELGNIVNPLQLGNPRETAGETGLSSYWPVLVKGGANWTESAVAPGAVVIACLCILPLVWKRVSRVWPMLAVALAGLLIALGTPVNSALYFGVPGWSSTGSPGRAIVLFLLAACVLAAVVAGHVVHVRDKEGTYEPLSPRALQLCCLVFALIAFGSFAIGQGGTNLKPQVPEPIFKAIVGVATAGGLLITLLLAAICIQPVLLNYYQSRMKAGRDLMVLFPATTVLAAIIAGALSTIPTGKPVEGPGKLEPRSSRVAHTNDNWGIVWYTQNSEGSIPGEALVGANIPPNLSTVRRELDVAGYDSLLHKDVQMWLSAIDNDKDPAPPANGNIMFVKSDRNEEKLAAAGVGSIDGQAIETPGRASLLTNGVEASVRITEQTLSSVTVAVENPGQLTLRDHNLGGWRAFAGNRELPLKPGPWLIVDVPEGTTSVVFRYTPPGLGAGLSLFAVSALVIGAFFLVSRRVTGNREKVQSESQ